MVFSPLANASRRIPDVGRSAPRNAPVSGFLIHHNAGVDAYGQATAAGREVSANYWITNAGEILPNIPEERRAFTSGAVGYPGGAEADHRCITVEVSNSPEGVRSGTWAISEPAQAALERLIGDVFSRYNLGQVRRGTHGGVAVHRDFVPTECPGGYIMSHLSEIIRNAEAARTGASAEDSLGGIMSYYDNKQQFRKDLAGIVRRHVPLAPMNSARASAKTGKPLRTNIATEIRRNTRNGDQTNRRGIRTESKLDGLREEVAQLAKAVQELGKVVGAAPAALAIDTAAVERAVAESAARISAELAAEEEETERFLVTVAEEDDDDPAEE